MKSRNLQLGTLVKSEKLFQGNLAGSGEVRRIHLMNVSNKDSRETMTMIARCRLAIIDYYSTKESQVFERFTEHPTEFAKFKSVITLLKESYYANSQITVNLPTPNYLMDAGYSYDGTITTKEIIDAVGQPPPRDCTNDRTIKRYFAAFQYHIASFYRPVLVQLLKDNLNIESYESESDED